MKAEEQTLGGNRSPCFHGWCTGLQQGQNPIIHCGAEGGERERATVQNGPCREGNRSRLSLAC